MGKRDKGKQREVLIEAVRTSGEPVKVVAARMGVKDSTAYYWMKRARAARVPEFVRVVPRSSAAKARIVVEVGGAVIRLESGFDAELLVEVMSVLRGQSA
jgi:transposase-like protein